MSGAQRSGSKSTTEALLSDTSKAVRGGWAISLLAILILILVASAFATGTRLSQAAKAPTTAPGRINGKIVFSTDRQLDHGVKLWTMNPDGSDATQLTFDSERGP